MFILPLVLAAFAQVPVATSFTGALWEYPLASVDQVSFEICVDANCQRALPADLRIATDPTAPPDHGTFAFPLPPLLAGDHSVRVQSCLLDTPEICSDPSTVSFRLVVAPPAVTGLRVPKGD